jgi:hypothetical protein
MIATTTKPAPPIAPSTAPAPDHDHDQEDEQENAEDRPDLSAYQPPAAAKGVDWADVLDDDRRRADRPEGEQDQPRTIIRRKPIAMPLPARMPKPTSGRM